MKRLLLSLFTLVFLFAFSSGAQATSFTFSASDEGGTGSADMDISILGNILTLTLDNTSPITLDPPLTGENTPGITGFGFDLTNDPLPNLISWSLTAYLSDLTGTVIIGSNSVAGDWIMDTFLAGVRLDYIPTNEGVADGMLFNPLAYGSSLLPSGVANDVFYTTAILIMDFDAAPVLLDSDDSPFVRMQNVGLDAEGSLKLYDGNGGGGGGDPIPEPATMLLLGSGLIGIAFGGKKRFKKTNK